MNKINTWQYIIIVCLFYSFSITYSLVDDMVSSNTCMSIYTVSYTNHPIETDLHFKKTLSLLQNFQQTSIQVFFVFFYKNSSKLCCIYTSFSKMCPKCKRRLSTYRSIHTSSKDHNRGQISNKCTALTQNDLQ